MSKPRDITDNSPTRLTTLDELEAVATLQAAQAEIARLTKALEERRDDVGRLAWMVSTAGLEIEHLNAMVSTAGLEIEHLNAVIDRRGSKITDLLEMTVNAKRREDDLTAELEYQRTRVYDLGRRLTVANDQAEQDAAAVLAAEHARIATERALKELQDQVVGAIASAVPAPSYTVPDEIEGGPAGPSREGVAGDELQRLRPPHAEMHNLRSDLSHRTGQVEGMQAGAEFMKREVARLEAWGAKLNTANTTLQAEVDSHLQERLRQADRNVDQIHQLALAHEDHTKALRAENARLRAELAKTRGSK